MVLDLSRCRFLIEHGGIAEPDADISGLGVITAFVFSGYVTLVTVIVAYVFGLVDEGLLRPIDRLVLRAPSRAAKHPQVHVALRKAILALSDQQIVTGIAILGAGFQGLRTYSINVYHFQIVIYLAWMSSSVHLSALTILRPFLHFHRGVMVWRLIGMLVLLIMLTIALVPTISNDWAVVSINAAEPDPIQESKPYSDFGIPAICFWGKLWGDGINPDSILSFCVLFISYIWKMGGMFMPFRRQFEHFIRSPIDHLLEMMLASAAQRYERTGSFQWLWLFRLCLAVYLPITAVLETLASFSAALWLSTLGLIYGTMQILIPRTIMHDINPTLVEKENEWGFGQLIPLILLVQPLGAVSEHLWLSGQQDDEFVYQDHHGHIDPYNSDLGDYQDGKHVVNLPDKPLLQFIATYKKPGWTANGPQRIQLKAFLYTSKLFHFLVWSVHAATAGTAAVVFWTDYQYIGYVSTLNWYYIVFGMGAWAAVAPISAFILTPWSRLGQYKAKKRKALFARRRAQKLNLETANDKPPESESSMSPATVELGNVRHVENTGTETDGPPAATPLPTTPELDARQGEVWASEIRRRSHSSTLRPVLASELRRQSTRSAKNDAHLAPG